MKARIYLRASTKEQDASRAEEQLLTFSKQNQLEVINCYIENASGTKLNRPELMKLLDDAKPDEILLVESVDRLSRLNMDDWQTLKNTITDKGLFLVICDLPTSHYVLQQNNNHQQGTDLAKEVLKAVNGMLIDLMATMARLDQEKRVQRIREGQANAVKRARAEGRELKIGGRNKDQTLRDSYIKMVQNNPKLQMQQIAMLLECGVSTVYRIKRELGA